MTIALSAAASGISTMETEIDSVGNNVANADTDGYQETDPEFENLLTEQLTPAGSASAQLASTNPSSIGSGAEVAGMQTNFSQGAIVQTGVPTDVAIQGNGFFVVDQGGKTFYTRAGDFQLDVNGTLSTQNGGIVQGWSGNSPTTGPTGPISIPSSLEIPPKETQNVTLSGNIPSGGAAFDTTATIYDAQGHAVPLTISYTPTATPNQWTMQASINGTNLFSSGVNLTFNSSGQLLNYSVDGGATTAAAGATTIPTTQPLPAGFDFNETSINFDLPAPGSTSAVTQFTSGQALTATPDGYQQASLQGYSIGQDGVIVGTFTNGQSQNLGTVAISTFSNPGGLDNLGNLEYQTTAASGQAQITAPGSNGSGTLLGGALEQSNVDLATNLTDLIQAQTDYEADTKVISTDQTVLQSLVTEA